MREEFIGSLIAYMKVWTPHNADSTDQINLKFNSVMCSSMTLRATNCKAIFYSYAVNYIFIHHIPTRNTGSEVTHNISLLSSYKMLLPYRCIYCKTCTAVRPSTLRVSSSVFSYRFLRSYSRLSHSSVVNSC
jgi:hypothetical protein